MTKTKFKVTTKERKNKIINSTKGYRGSQSTLYRIAKQQYIRACKNSYFGRKNKKRIFKKIWIHRINGSLKMLNSCYSRFSFQLKNKSIYLNKKSLAKICINNFNSFKVLLNQ